MSLMRSMDLLYELLRQQQATKKFNQLILNGTLITFSLEFDIGTHPNSNEK